ncbi:MAG: hypothetical protein IPH78_09570 [Bacteroidetes bacterium]|nr:hypothetical protein [Bacteroidota bacterium]
MKLISNLRKGKTARIFLLSYLLCFLIELLAPVSAYALTSGPAQPEVASFEPSGTTDMVNLFSGDFTYNIPLFELPGPNGGYPINLAYNAGVNMDDEASWVGLGWNLNPGVVNRNMRGVPDDFDGDLIKTDLDVKKDWTLSMTNTVSPEIWAFDMGSIGLSFGHTIRYNSYRGFGFGQSAGVNFSGGGGNIQGGAGLGISFDSDEGAGVDFNGGISSGSSKKFSGSISAGIGVNSRVGLQSMSLSVSGNGPLKGVKTSTGKTIMSKLLTQSSNISFSSPAFTPDISMPMKGFNLALSFKIGGDIGGVFINFGGNVSYSQQELKYRTKKSRAFGYLHLQSSTGIEREDGLGTMVDVNREKDVVLSRFVPNLAAPHLTYDVFNVQGQGMQNMFRPYRNDIGASFDEYAKSVTAGGGLGGEIGGGLPVHFGVSGDINYSESESGKWVNNSDFNRPYMSNDANAGSNPGDYGDFEAVFFKATGEHTAEPVGRMQQMVGGSKPLKLNIDGPDRMSTRLSWAFSDKDDVDNNSVLGNDARKGIERKPRANNFIPLRNNELTGLQEFNVQFFNPASVGDHLTYADFEEYYGGNNAYIGQFNRTSRDGYSSAMPIDKHIGGISALNHEGMRYIYGISAYNNVQIDANFSVVNTGDYCNQTISGIAAGQDILYYKHNATDQFKQETYTPPYAHSYLLTAIVGPDYVDVNGNGPSDDDFGYWVKFNYFKAHDNYKWRAPYKHNEANYIGGFRSDENDDKGVIMYGEKEIWYLASAETKTHLALFCLSKREDAMGAKGYATVDYNNPSNPPGAVSFKLDSIQLHSKDLFLNNIGNNTPTRSLQTVHLNYNYSLCQGAYNSSSGKLTLEKLYFTYDGSSRGALSPYTFNYGLVTAGNSSTQQNPGYNPIQYDRWGNYEYNADNCRKTVFPYVNQSDDPIDQENRIKYATAWNLTDIGLPTGSSIHVNYEQDDYAYVQDKTAMQMFKIAALGNGLLSPNKHIIYDQNSRQANNPENRRIFFKLEKPIPITGVNIQTELNKYLDESRQLYFKVYMPMKKETMYEYVSGYLDIEEININTECINSSNTAYDYAYVVVKRYEKKNGDPMPYHPITVASLMSLKQNLPQKAYRSSALESSNGSTDPKDMMMDFLKAVAASFESLGELFTGFYNGKTLSTSRWSDRIDLDNSYIRLNSYDKKKYGGGIRVASIEINDQWEDASGEPSSTYGTTYEYTTTEPGYAEPISSGVATFEPAIGGEENALRWAKKYPFNVSVTTQNTNFYQYPINETLYPAPSVGYSKVTVKSLNTSRKMKGITTDVGFNSSGVTVNQFYTAKDYPIYSEETKLRAVKDSKSLRYQKLIIPLPGVGQLAWDYFTASQGYVTELNDMHGKPRKTETYSITAQNKISDQPVSSVEYIYFDELVTAVDPGSENPKVKRRLLNEVPVLISDPDPNDLTKARIENKLVGVDYEMYTDQRNSSTKSGGGGLNFNVELLYIVPIVLPWPSVNTDFRQLRVAVTNKVIHRSGILKEIRARDGQSLVRTENKVFDPYTGGALLSTVTNNFDDDVWNYTIPAHIKYAGTGPAYKNLGQHFEVPAGDITKVDPQNNNGDGTDDFHYLLSSLSQEVLLKPGDVLKLEGTSYKAIVISVNASTALVEFFDNTNTPSTVNIGSTNKFKIVRSGWRNQLTVSAGKITALKDPTKDRIFETCQNTVSVQLPPANSSENCLLSINVGFMMDTIQAVAAHNSGAVFIPMNKFAEPNPGAVPVVATLINKGYIGVMVDNESNYITFQNLNGESCSFYFYTGWNAGKQVFNTQVNIGDLPSPLFPLSTCNPGYGYPVQYNGASLAGCRYEIVVYQSPYNCFCSMMDPFSVPQTFTEIYTDTMLKVEQVINTSATVLSEFWGNTFDEGRYSEPPVDIERNYKLNKANDFMNGRNGIWRPESNFIYFKQRDQQLNDMTRLSVDGTFTMAMFDWRKPYEKHCDPDWVNSNQITKYNAYNHEVENRDPLNNFSSALYSYNGKLPIAVGNNTPYHEFGFEGFEEYNPTDLYSEYSGATGNLSFSTQHASVGDCSQTSFNTYKKVAFTIYVINGSSYIRFHNLQPTPDMVWSGIKLHYGLGLFRVGLSSSIPSPTSFPSHTCIDATPNSLIFSKAARLGSLTAPFTVNSNCPPLTSGGSFYHGIAEIPICLPVPGNPSTISGTSIVKNRSHTGLRAMSVNGMPVKFDQVHLDLETGKKYQFSSWVSREAIMPVSTYEQNNADPSDNLRIELVDNNSNVIATFFPKGPVIGSWQKVEGEFAVIDPATDYVSVRVYSGKVNGVVTPILLDDIRIYPYKSNMISYVYDNKNYRLKAKLDNNNYATFYYYDEAGKLFLTKQETERGIYTVQENKTNVPEQN